MRVSPKLGICLILGTYCSVASLSYFFLKLKSINENFNSLHLNMWPTFWLFRRGWCCLCQPPRPNHFFLDQQARVKSTINYTLFIKTFNIDHISIFYHRWNKMGWTSLDLSLKRHRFFVRLSRPLLLKLFSEHLDHKMYLWNTSASKT